MWKRVEKLMLSAVTVCVTACLRPVVQPAPVQMTTPRSPSDVVSQLSADLTAEGFEITTVDPSAGVVTARRSRRATEQGSDIRCQVTPGSLNDPKTNVALSISASARRDSSRTVVVFSSRATMPSIGDGSATESYCAPTGELERRLAARLQETR